MAELDRTFTEELFTEVLESTPCIIVYSQQAFECSKNYLKSTTQTAKEIFESILGVHQCKIIYKGKNKKDFRKYQFIIEELKLSIYVTPRQNLTEFSLNYISDEEFVVPTDSSEYKSMNLKFMAEEYINHNLMDFLDRNDLMTSYREIKDFCTSLLSLKEPVREINREQSRKMWKAYIDGERALNTDKKELFIVEEVGSIEKEHYNDRTYNTLTLKVKAPTLQERLTSAIKSVQATKYRNPNIDFVTNNKGEISFVGYVDITEEILEEKGFGVDEDGFKEAMEVQRKKARSARKKTNYMGADATVYEQLDKALTTKFVGYDKLISDTVVTALTTEKEVVQALVDGDKGTIVTEETPFYGTMGGQVGDKGIIVTNGGEFKVEETIHLLGGKIGHVGTVVKGMIQVGDKATMKVDSAFRADTSKNHSATHLLQKALKTVLGEHVEQAGSYVDADRLRFDFTHFQAMTKEEIEKVENLVNEQIATGLDVITKEMSLDEAKETGAMALFGEKYGEKVRVVSMGDYSIELCGGTHVSNTNAISSFKIISESGVAAGVRRIEALTGDGVMKYYLDEEKTLHEAAKAAKAEPHKLAEKIQSMLDEIKALTAENEKLKDQIAKSEVADVMDQVVEAGDYKVLPVSVKDVDMNALRTLGDDLKDKIGSGVIILASDMGGKVNLIVTATDDAVKAGAHAGKIIKEAAALVGGGGGGRPNMAQAGGKNPAGIKAALEKAVEIAKEQL